MIDKNSSFDIENGLLVEFDQSGDKIEGPFYTGGPSSPVGLDLPANTFYVQNVSTGILIWKKFNTGINDWRKLGAEDLYFDYSVAGFSPSIVTIQQALDLLKGGGGSGVSGTVIGGATGNLPSGSYLSSETVPMNTVPFDLSLKNVVLRSVTFRNKNTVTGSLVIEYYDVSTLSWVVGYTVNVTASNNAIVRGLSVPFPDEPQLRYKTNIAIKNPKLVANFNGDSAT